MAVEEAVREAGGYSPADIGTDLMRKAFNQEMGKLTDSTQSKRNVRPVLTCLLGLSEHTKTRIHIGTVNLTDPREAEEQVLLA